MVSKQLIIDQYEYRILVIDIVENICTGKAYEVRVLVSSLASVFIARHAGSPFKFYVDSLGTGHVSAYGPGLTHGRCGEPAEFVLVTKDAGTGARFQLDSYA